jgi:hypothetical protein
LARFRLGVVRGRLWSFVLTAVQHVILSNCANLYNTYVTAVAMKAITWK